MDQDMLFAISIMLGDIYEKSFSLYPSRFLAETPPVIKDRLTGEKQTEA